MHYFIHGDHQLSSRNFLNEIIDKHKTQGLEITRLDGKRMTLAELIETTSAQSLFGATRFIVIEDLFSRLKSKEQENILNWLKDYQSEIPLVLWESKPIGKVLQRRLPQQVTFKEFKTPEVIFKFVEQLSPSDKPKLLQSLQLAVAQEAPEFLFVMIARQIRLLLLIKGNQKITGAPWMLGKLKKQAEAFTPKQLLKTYQQLYQIDKNIKTGNTIMPLSWHLNQIVLDL